MVLVDLLRQRLLEPLHRLLAAREAALQLADSRRALLVDGLYGYNPSLTAVAIGGMFFMPSIRSFLYSMLACVFTTVLSAATAAGLGPVGMPALTFPFTLASWIFVYVGLSNPIPGLMTVSLPMVTYPENHRDRFKACTLVSHHLEKMLGKLPVLIMQNESDLVRIESRILPVIL